MPRKDIVRLGSLDMLSKWFSNVPVSKYLTKMHSLIYTFGFLKYDSLILCGKQYYDPTDIFLMHN